MKALSLWQPWATAIAIGVKRIETRSWGTNFRGRIAIHATLKLPQEGIDHFHKMDEASKRAFAAAGIHHPSDLTLGAVVATCEVVDCVPQTQEFVNRLPRLEYPWGGYAVGRFAWILDNVNRFPVPLPVGRGGQRIWNWTDQS